MTLTSNSWIKAFLTPSHWRTPHFPMVHGFLHCKSQWLNYIWWQMCFMWPLSHWHWKSANFPAFISSLVFFCGIQNHLSIVYCSVPRLISQWVDNSWIPNWNITCLPHLHFYIYYLFSLKPLLSIKHFLTDFIRAILGSQQNWGGRYSDLLYILCPYTGIVSPIINGSRQSGTFVIIYWTYIDTLKSPEIHSLH